jgi:hypothetical protein
MRPAIAPVLVLAAALATPASLGWAADGGTALVVPGRPGVPTMYFGRDISWAVVEGERGLDRPGNEITIVPSFRSSYGAARAGGYYPSTGMAPRSGRREVEPPSNRSLPPPAESYHRQWGAESAHTPVTIPAPYGTPPVMIGVDGRQGQGQGRPRPVRPPRPLPPRTP